MSITLQPNNNLLIIFKSTMPPIELEEPICFNTSTPTNYLACLDSQRLITKFLNKLYSYLQLEEEYMVLVRDIN